jgi:hypothetical protein
MRGTDVIDRETGKVRVLSQRCQTCVFRRDGPWDSEIVDELIDRNIAAEALLTCHSTLPYGANPDFGPAVCAGFWSLHGMSVLAGRLAMRMRGIIRVKPPGEEKP